MAGAPPPTSGWTGRCTSTAVSPDTALEDWGLRCATHTDSKGKPYLYIVNPAYYGIYDAPLGGQALSTDLRIEVSDYWYRVPRKNARIEAGKPVKFETWNAIFVGNYLVKNKRHTEYRGKLPYVPLFNSYVPGLPDGRSSLHDVEQLLREKDERLSENAQMIHRAVAGQLWQLTGPEAPATVPPGLKPQPNKVLAPGAGNRLEALQPWMPEFQIEQFLARLDRELTDISGLNELMRGMAPAQVMNSGKAIAALVSQLRDPREDAEGPVLQVASGYLGPCRHHLGREERPDEGRHRPSRQAAHPEPDLTPRDDAEASSIALNMKEGKLWSAARAMDRTGVDDPEAELDLIRAEQTDATINPASVQVMVSLMAMLQQMQQAAPPQLAQAGQEAGAGMAAQMAAMRGTAPQSAVTESMNEPGRPPRRHQSRCRGIPPRVRPWALMVQRARCSHRASRHREPKGLLRPRCSASTRSVEGEAQPRIVGQQEIQREEGGVSGPDRSVRSAPASGARPFEPDSCAAA